MADDDTIYVDVAARLDEASADRAVSEMKGKLSHVGDSLKDSLSGALGSVKDHVKDLGGTIHDVLGDSLRDHVSGIGGRGGGGALGDAFDNLGERAGTVLGQGLGNAIHDALQGQLGNILGDGLRPAIDELKSVGGNLANSFAQAQTHVEGIADAVSSIGSGSAGDTMNSIGALLGHVGALGDQFHSKKLSAVGKFGSVLGDSSSLVNNFVGPAAGDKGIGDSLEDILTGAEGGAIAGGGLGSIIPGLGTTVGAIGGGVIGAGGAIAHDWDSIGHHMPWYHKPDTSSSPQDFTGVSQMLMGQSPYPTSGGSGKAGDVEVQSSTATVSAGSVTVTGGVNPPQSMSASRFDPHSYTSSGGGSKPGLNMPGGNDVPAPHAGEVKPGDLPALLGLKPHDAGGLLPGGSPGHDNQVFSGEGGEFVVNPAATQQNMSILQAINSDGNNGPVTGQQLGSGSGFGLTGGGLLGLAEQLPAIAASAAGGAGGMFGGGAAGAGAAAAMQIAIQQANLAIQKGGQAVATLAASPFETFGLSGGQMGAPSVNVMGGWPGKLLGGLIGSQTNLPNIAGAVQAPKQPGQQDPPGQDPGNGGQANGPAGTKDDPMHVKSVNPPSGPPQGTATSAAGLNASMATGIGAKS